MPGYRLFLMMILLSACAATKLQVAGRQGIEGNIYLVSGNQMPGPGRPLNKGRGVSRTVYFYAPTTGNETQGTAPLYTNLKTKLIAQTKSDSTGHYSIKLPAGKYSVFINEAGHLFAAESDGTGTLNPVDVLSKTITKKDFTLNHNAAY
jgi:hypothetical protein